MPENILIFRSVEAIPRIYIVNNVYEYFRKDITITFIKCVIL
jgi:hypothetical protein